MESGNITYRLLEKVDSPADIKGFSIDELRELCAEIRHYMIECCSVNPGHLGSSLGAVELIIGLHYVYDAPADKLVFDVGHQAYAHKIITGRREAFRKNRMRTASAVSQRDPRVRMTHSEPVTHPLPYQQPSALPKRPSSRGSARRSSP